MERQKYSDSRRTGLKKGNIFQNGACIHEFGETKRVNGGSEIATIWSCALLGLACTYDSKTKNCLNHTFTRYKRPKESQPTFGVKAKKKRKRRT